MAADPRKRQKKLQRRAGKRQKKKHDIAKAQNAGMAEKIAKAAKHPILHAFVMDALWTSGMGSLIVSRQLPNGSVAIASFLIDRYCLGVKDAFADIRSMDVYEESFIRGMRSQFPCIDLAPATARKFVEAAVAYAADLGFPPHPDYHKAKAIFGDIDAADSDETLEFGKDGKPFFISGPDDNFARCNQIVAILGHRCGDDGFHSTIILSDEGEFAFEDEEYDAAADDLDDDDDGDDDGDGGDAGDAGPVIILDENEVRRLPKQ